MKLTAEHKKHNTHTHTHTHSFCCLRSKIFWRKNGKQKQFLRAGRTNVINTFHLTSLFRPLSAYDMRPYVDIARKRGEREKECCALRDERENCKFINTYFSELFLSNPVSRIGIIVLGNLKYKSDNNNNESVYINPTNNDTFHSSSHRKNDLIKITVFEHSHRRTRAQTHTQSMEKFFF